MYRLSHTDIFIVIKIILIDHQYKRTCYNASPIFIVECTCFIKFKYITHKIQSWLNGPIPFKSQNYTNSNTVLVLTGDILEMLQFLYFYKSYFSINHGKVSVLGLS